MDPVTVSLLDECGKVCEQNLKWALIPFIELRQSDQQFAFHHQRGTADALACIHQEVVLKSKGQGHSDLLCPEVGI